MRLAVWVSVALALAGAAGCSADRDAEGLGPHYEQYLAAQKAHRTEEAVRHLYQSYLDTLRSRDPAKVRRFFRPDLQAETLNALRMGFEFTKVLTHVDGQILELQDLVRRVFLRTRESATFRFRGRTQTDRRDRTYQLTRVGDHWYFDPPDLGRARKRK